MTSLLRVESWRDGTFVTARTCPNANAAKVYMAHQIEAGYHALLIHPRTETERAA
jgi:hypothetical protein